MCDQLGQPVECAGGVCPHAAWQQAQIYIIKLLYPYSLICPIIHGFFIGSIFHPTTKMEKEKKDFLAGLLITVVVVMAMYSLLGIS